MINRSFPLISYRTKDIVISGLGTRCICKTSYCFEPTYNQSLQTNFNLRKLNYILMEPIFLTSAFPSQISITSQPSVTGSLA